MATTARSAGHQLASLAPAQRCNGVGSRDGVIDEIRPLTVRYSANSASTLIALEDGKCESVIRGSVEVGRSQRTAAKPSQGDYARCINKLANKLKLVEHGLRIMTASA